MAQTHFTSKTDDATASILTRMPGAEHSEIKRLLADREALIAYLALTNDLTHEEARDMLELSQIANIAEADPGALRAA